MRLGVVCMMDNTLVHGRTCKDHDEQLQLVLQQLSESGMTLISEKCQFAQELVKFLGHVIDSSESDLTPTKSQPSKEYQPLPLLERLAAFWAW